MEASVNYLLSSSELPTGFVYPHEFLRIVDLGLVNLEPWYILYDQFLTDRYEGLRDRYPDHTLIPFAARQDRDDVACWGERPPNVIVIHDFASPGWERRATFPDFYSWLR